MIQKIELNKVKDFFLILISAIFSINFHGLSEPMIPILCGIVAGRRSLSFSPRVTTFAFLLIIFCSLLENAPWFITESMLFFGISGLLVSWISLAVSDKFKQLFLWRLVEVIPIALIIFYSPFPTSFLTQKKPRVGMIDAGVWAKEKNELFGAEALATQFQYDYHQFVASENATWIKPNNDFSGFDELVLCTPTEPFDDDFSNRLCKWISRGGRLLVVADHTNLFGHQTVLERILSKFKIGLRPDAVYDTVANGGTYTNWFNTIAGLTPCSISKGVVSRLSATGWSERPDYTKTSFFGDLDPSNDDRWGNYTVLGSRRVGLGEISVFSDSTFFANFAVNRWSSKIVIGSLFWNKWSTVFLICSFGASIIYLRTGKFTFVFMGFVFCILSPSIGFSLKKPMEHSKKITLKPPTSVLNDSEERDRGVGSALLASAYAFGVEIDWSSHAPYGFKDLIQKNGITLKQPKDDESDLWDKIPQISVDSINNGKFYVDQNDFWFGQGAGPLRVENMANFWRSIGANIPKDSPLLAKVTKIYSKLKFPDGHTSRCQVDQFSDNWTIIDQKIMAKWLPDAKKYLVRNEWQLGSWLKSDIVIVPEN